MTREQIAELRKERHWLHDDKLALLAAAERALLLEDVLAAAKDYMERLLESRDNEDDEMQPYLDDNEECAWDKMCAAIDRAEGEP